MNANASSCNPVAVLKRNAYRTNEEYRNYVLNYHNAYAKKRYVSDEGYRKKTIENAKAYYQKTRTEEKAERQRRAVYVKALNTGKIKKLNPQLAERYNIEYNSDLDLYLIKDSEESDADSI